MEKMANIYLVRHGETAWNVKQKIQGHSDIPLNEKGEKQAELLGERFKEQRISAVYASDLLRAKKTAEAVARHHDVAVQTFFDLRERCFGELEGKFSQDVFSDPRVERAAVFQQASGVESMEQLKQRMQLRLEWIAREHDAEDVLVVSHGGAINAFLSVVSNGEVGAGVTKLYNTAVSLLSKREGQWQIDYVNDVRHLKGVYIPE